MMARGSGVAAGGAGLGRRGARAALRASAVSCVSEALGLLLALVFWAEVLQPLLQQVVNNAGELGYLTFELVDALLV